MTFCNECGKHIIRKYILVKNYKDPVPLINIPKTILQKLPIDILEKIKKEAKDGRQMCGDYRNVCRAYIDECAVNFEADDGRTYSIDGKKFREILITGLGKVRDDADQKVIKDIMNEAERRINILKVKKEVGKQQLVLPDVPIG